MSGADFMTRVSVLVAIALLMTVGVYGLVGGIVKLDDLGLWLSRTGSGLRKALGNGILRAAPWLMKFLSVAGTAAMFLVGGSILVHGIPALHHWVEAHAGHWLASSLVEAVVGIVAGILVVVVVTAASRLRGRKAPAAS